MNSRRIIAAAVLLVVGAGIGVGIVTALSDDDDGGSASDTPTPETTRAEAQRPDADENPEAAELYDLINSFPTLTLHAKYSVKVAASPNTESLIEVWQKDGKVRQDAEISTGATGTGRVAILDLEDRVILCQQPPNGKYTCSLASEQQQTTFESLRTNLLVGLGDQQVKARDDTIDGREVRCFSIQMPSKSDLCITPEGVLVSITSDQGTFTLLELDENVDDAVFTPPAAPGATTA